ncbi:MAG TPA: hypothetical protein VM165_06930 [Planctomycetaceae bacterium]|nr:hypothetical protein [Planctomycetaceae bacterium]
MALLTPHLIPFAGFEVGLDSDIGHFEGDAQKLANNRIPVQYLIHLCRILRPPQQAVREAIESMRIKCSDQDGCEFVLVAAFPKPEGRFELLLPGHAEWQEE